VSFAAAHADGRPQRAIPQKSKLESLNSGNNMLNCHSQMINHDTPLMRPAALQEAVQLTAAARIPG
jgi:hypothetical protein